VAPQEFFDLPLDVGDQLKHRVIHGTVREDLRQLCVLGQSLF